MFYKSVSNFLQKIVLRNNSEIMEWYLKPPFAPTVKVYVFNYTNIEEFMAGIDQKIRINQVGPYVYQEPMERINVKFDEDRMTYKVSVTFFFRGNLNDNFTNFTGKSNASFHSRIVRDAFRG